MVVKCPLNRSVSKNSSSESCASVVQWKAETGGLRYQRLQGLPLQGDLIIPFDVEHCTVHTKHSHPGIDDLLVLVETTMGPTKGIIDATPVPLVTCGGSYFL